MPSTRRGTLHKIEYAGSTIEVAERIRPGGDDLLLCLHGLGCAKESFDSAFESDQLNLFSIYAFDFPGHGSSGRAPDSAYSIQAYADVTVRLVRQLDPRRVFIVGHSMGCAVGLVATQELGELVGGFVSIEGNLVGQDCGLISRAAATLPETEFVEQRSARFQAEIASSPHPALRTWSGWYAQADPVALHRIAGSLVEWSDSGKLLSLFTTQPGAAYVHGTESGDLDYLLPSLAAAGVRLYSIPHSGHFPMLDNPAPLWDAVADSVAARLVPLA